MGVIGGGQGRRRSACLGSEIAFLFGNASCGQVADTPEFVMNTSSTDRVFVSGAVERHRHWNLAPRDDS